MSIFFENVDSLPSWRERFCWFHICHLNWVVKCSTNKVKVRSELICTLSLLILTTFCKPSMRLLTTCRRPLSSWNMVLSSSHERSHISAPTSSVFWPMMFVVMEGLTSTTSVLSLTILASSGGAGKTRRQGERGTRMSNTDDGDGKHIWEIRWLKHRDSDFLFSRTRTNAHNNVVITMFIVFPKTDVRSAAFDLWNVSVWKGDVKSFHQGWQQGWLCGVIKKKRQTRNWNPDAPCVKPHCCRGSLRTFELMWHIQHELNRPEWPHGWICPWRCPRLDVGRAEYQSVWKSLQSSFIP